MKYIGASDWPFSAAGHCVPTGPVAVSRDIFGCPTWKVRDSLLASGW